MSNWEILAQVRTGSGAFFGGGCDLEVDYRAWDGTNNNYPDQSSAVSGPVVFTVNTGDSFEEIHVKAAAALRNAITVDPATVRFLESPGAY